MANSFPTIRPITQSPQYHWFGYYDKLQIDPTNRYALSMEVDFEHRSPNADETIKLWRVSDGLRLDTLSQPLKEQYVVEFSPDGQRILTASWDDTAKLWDLQGTLLADLDQHTSPITAALFSPDGQVIVTTSRDSQVKLWDRSGNFITDMEESSYVTLSADFSPDGQFILTCGQDRLAKIWNLKGDLVTMLRGHQESLRSAVFSPDGKTILTASDDKTARIWDALTGQELLQLEGHEKGIKSAAFYLTVTRAPKYLQLDLLFEKYPLCGNDAS